MSELAKTGEKIILMKSGLVHFISKEAGDRMSIHLATQSGHSFILVSELNITINTAEVEAVYNQKEYEDICRIKSGEWKCSFGSWHQKKGECHCRAERMREEAERKRKEQEAEMYKPLTEEDSERIKVENERACLDRGKESFVRALYSVGNSGGRSIRRSTITAWENETGRKADLQGLAINENENPTTRI